MSKHPGGRPRIIENAEAMQKIIDLYIEEIEIYNDNPANKESRLFKVPILEELVHRLGLSNRSSFFEYAHNPEFSNTIKKAKNKILAIQKQLAMQGLINPTISIFNWKNNFGMKDKTEVEQTTTHKYENMTEEEIDKRIQELEG